MSLFSRFFDKVLDLTLGRMLYNYLDVDETMAAIQAELDAEDAFSEEGEASDEVMSDLFWVLNADGLKQVFEIARAEPDDDLAILTIAANTKWTMSSTDDEDEDLEEE